MGLIVYGANMSPFVRKVRVALAEKGVAYDLDPVNPFAPPPDFLKISPLKRIPVLRDTDRPEPNTLPDSTVICDYFEHKYPEPALYPADPFARAEALWFEEYADSAVAQTIGRGLFFERIVKKLLRQQPDETICATTLTEKIPPVFDYLEAALGDRDYLVGGPSRLPTSRSAPCWSISSMPAKRPIRSAGRSSPPIWRAFMPDRPSRPVSTKSVRLSRRFARPDGSQA